MLWTINTKKKTMKISKLFNKLLLVLAVSLLSLQSTHAQDSKQDKKEQQAEKIRNLLQSKNFVFVAQYAYPLGGRNINLTSVYDIRLSADTLVSDLPYFGRAYVAPMNPSEGGIHFTSTKFAYDINEKKKGRWNILIAPKDTRDVREMFLSVSESGNATLQVTSNNRQQISFAGYITTKKNFR